MEISEPCGDLAAALAKAQGQITGAVKDSENPFFKSRYADLASVWDACRAPLSSNGLAVVQSPSVEGSIVSVETLLVHASGQWVRGTMSAIAKDASPQSIGSAVTYLRRYALQSVAGVAPEEDDGNAATASHTAPAARGEAYSPAPAAQPQPAHAQPSAPLAPGVTYVKGIQAKKGASAKGPWCRRFVTFADGRDGVTFSDTLALELEALAKSNTPVNPDIVATDKGNDLRGLLPITIPTPDDPAMPDDPVDGPEKVLVVRDVPTDAGMRWVIQTKKRELVTDSKALADEARAARTAGIGIVPAFTTMFGRTAKPIHRLTSLVVEVGEREPGSDDD